MDRSAYRTRGGRWGIGTAAVTLTGLTAVLMPARTDLSPASVSLLYLLPVVTTAVVGGVWPALAAAVAADLLVNFFFLPPYHTLVVENRDNTVLLVVYVLTAGVVAVAVDVAARQQATAARRDIEATMLASVTAEPVAEDSLTRLLDHVRGAFAMDTVALVESGRDGPATVARAGPPEGGEPVLDVPAADGLRLLAWGPQIFAENRRVLERLAAAAARTLEAQRLAGQAARARELAEIDRLRSALLSAVGHDLRTPLTGIKAAVSSLRQADIEWTADQRAELLATIEESTDRLDALIDNLLSMSRLQAGALAVDLRPVALDAVVAQAVLHTPAGGPTIELDVPDDVPHVRADPGLLERVIANLVANAQAASPPDLPISLCGRSAGDRVRLQVVDHGRGVPEADWDRIFEPFQRRDDRTTTAGLGLGLAIARGFTEAMEATLTPSVTPGGGLTMTISLPTAGRA
jgi:K+-sensing histidine kinase KdpD